MDEKNPPHDDPTLWPSHPALGTASDKNAASAELGDERTRHFEAVAGMQAFLQLSQEGFTATPPAGSVEQTVMPMSATTVVIDAGEIPGYEILGELGRGGMGVVYKARQKGLKRIVALKMVLTGGHAGSEQLARFRAEAEAVARLQHPGIVQVYEIGENEGRPFFSMEFVDGPSLSQQLGRELPTPQKAASLVARLADAVQYAHQHGIIHRDLKPANILIPNPGPTAFESQTRTATYDPDGPAGKIADFGLAKQVQEDSGLTQSGAVMGTPSYMAPEQASGNLNAVGPTTDVYALGAILYECLTGRPPFRAPSLADTLDQVRRSEPVPPSRLQAGVPRDLEVIALKCLRKEQAKRYATASELAEDIRRFIDGKAILARPVGYPERTWRWCKRNPAVAGLLAVCAIVFVIGTIGTTWNAMAAREKARDALLAKSEAEQSAADAIHALDRAMKSEREAIAATERAKDAGRKTTRNLVRLHIASGSNAVESGDLLSGLLWYEKAWDTDRTLGSSDAAHRTRFAGVFGRLPALRACFFHPDAVRQIQWHPGGRWLVARTESRFLLMWDATNPAADPLRLEGVARVTHFALSRDGATLAACQADGSCALWSIPDGKPLIAPPAHPKAVVWVAFHPTESRLATACEDGKIRFWNTESGKEVGPVIDMPGPASFVEFDDKGRNVLVATESNAVRVFDAKSGVPTCPLTSHHWHHLRVSGEQFGSSVEPRFSPDGESFAGAWNGPFVRRTMGGELIDEIDFAEQSVRRLEWSADGKRVLVQSKTLSRWWKPGTETVASDRLLHPRESWVGAIHPNGTHVATASTAGKLHIWNTATGTQVIQPIQHVGDINAVRYSPDGSCVAAGGMDGTLRIWEPLNPALAPQSVPDGEPDSFTRPAIVGDRSRIDWVSKDGRFLITGRPMTRTFEVTRRDTRERLFELPYPEKVLDVGFTADSRLLYLRQASDLQLWDIETRTCVVKSAALKGSFVSVVSAAAANRALVIDDEQFQVFDLKTGQLLLGPIAQQAADPAEWGPADFTGYRIKRGDISPDGKRVVMPGGSYRVLRSYDVDTGTAIDVPLHDAIVYRASFDGSGRRVLTAASDSTARLWDPATGRPLAPPLWHPGFVRDAALSTDGRMAVTYCEAKDRSVWVWDAETADLLMPPLPFPSRPTWARVYFSADGRRIVSLYESNKGIRVVRWTIPVFRTPYEHVPLLVALFTGRRVDATAGLTPLRDDEIRTDRERYRTAFLAYHHTAGSAEAAPK